ncbi:MAG TPA: energy transducer TonB [Steroidobacteraceae bacterium]|nr:energy transducer TonB [Steroidobacteraceae bacterium]
MALHVALIYALCSWQPIRAVFHEVPIEASIIDAPVVAPEEVPPPPPQMMSVHVPAIEPPLVSIAEEPAPNAITVAKVEQQPAPAPQPATATPHEITDVAYIQPPAPKYPPESRRTGEEGLVVLRVVINEAGRAAQIEVERSSGYARLDAAARAAVERALFKPYIENGVARVATARIPIEFTWKSRAADRAGRS